RRWVSELKVPAVIAVVPVYQYVEETASYRDVRKRFDELAQSIDVPVYHVVDDLQRHPAEVRRMLRFEKDVHFTPFAHKLVGEALAKVVVPLLAAGASPDVSSMPHAAAIAMQGR
ncbi:MAG TPA: hypothetical protein VKS80_07125, partial [Trinickia sp.]|nr:hypothetical protein [Trinickia sp.]